MVLQKYGITFAVGSVPLGVIILFFLWTFWAGEEGGRGRKRGLKEQREGKGRRMRRKREEGRERRWWGGGGDIEL